MIKKKVLLSVKLEWCEKIFSGEKTIEVRKSAPKLKPPFEVLVYMTKPKKRLIEIIKDGDDIYGDIYHGKMLFIKMDRPVYDKNWNDVAGKVIGSFVCDRINEVEPDSEYYSYGYDIDDDRLSETCLTREQLCEYGKGKTLYGWRITEPKLFDKPRELSEFGTICNKVGNEECGECPYLRVLGNSFPCDDCVDIWCGVNNIKPIPRPPQSWQYIEEVLDE